MSYWEAITNFSGYSPSSSKTSWTNGDARFILPASIFVEADRDGKCSPLELKLSMQSLLLRFLANFIQGYLAWVSC